MSKKANENQGKKPFYKKWWVWVLIVILFFAIIANLGDSDADNNKVNNESTSGTDINADEQKDQDVDQKEVNTSDHKDTNTTDGNTSTQEDTDAAEEKDSDKITMGQKNALKKAKSYLDFSAFSYQGLINQLKYEGFSSEDATYAADNVGADWKEQAAKKAESYLDFSSFSRSGLIEQLEYEGFTTDEAEYGVSAVGY